MDLIDLRFSFELPPESNVINIIVGDLKDKFENDNEINFKGKIYFDINVSIANDYTTLHESGDIDIHLNKSNYHLQDLKASIKDYKYEIKNNYIDIIVHYEIKGKDYDLEKFCSLHDVSLENELRDYLHRDGQKLSQLNLEDDKIIILDPIIEEEPIEVVSKINETLIKKQNDNKIINTPDKDDQKEEKVEKNDEIIDDKIIISSDDFKDQEIFSPEEELNLEEIENIEYPFEDEENIKIEKEPVIFDEPTIKEKEPNSQEKENKVKEDLLKDNYITTFIYYRVTENDSIETISKKFNILPTKIKECNAGKVIKPNILIRIPKNV